MGTLIATSDLNRFTKREHNLHRPNLAVADAAGNLSGVGFTKTAGVNGDGYRRASIDCNLDSGTATSITYEVLYWSEDKAAFVSNYPPDIVTINTGTGQFLVEHSGRIFLVAVRTIDLGVNPIINISVRASWPDNQEQG